MIRVLVVDDHPIVRDGLVAVLSHEPDLTVVDAVSSAEEARRIVPALHPDVVLLDLELPGQDGIAAIPELAAGARVLVLTAYDTEERVFGALHAGAGGYLLKGATASEIAGAIRTVHHGDSALAPTVAARLVASVSSRRGRTGLSPREREVLGLLADGLTTKEMARRLYITERTVKFHVHSICAKLGAANRTQAVALAKQHDLL
ncbi:MAG TPA: response regulator transcription factor [Chloroflexota bacterium]|nr:response regulator transcription factor [Chloroflexota bacterium]